MKSSTGQPAERTSRSHPLLNVFGTTVEVLVDGATTEGASTVARIVCPPNGGTPLHSHKAAESFYVASGTITIVLCGREYTATQGCLFHAKPHAVHAFRNEATEDAVLLCLPTGSAKRPKRAWGASRIQVASISGPENARDLQRIDDPFFGAPGEGSYSTHKLLR